MGLRPELLDTFAARGAGPLSRRARARRLGLDIEFNRLDVLEEAYKEERHLVVRELLPETDAWSCVEREEDEGVGNEVFVKALIDEAIGVELLRYNKEPS